MDNTISEKIEELKNIKNTLKETINNKKDNNIDSDDFIINTNTFDSYASVINDKLTRMLPTVEINVNSGNSLMGTVNINGLGKTVSKKFTYNDKCTINAIPKGNSYKFVSWDDDDGNSCRTININELYKNGINNQTYTAIFQDVITPDEPDEDDTLDDPWYFWNGNSSWKENGLSFTDFNELTTTKYTYGDKNDIFSDIIIISPKGAAVSMNLKNSLEGENEIKLDEINTSGLIFEKLPKEFTENQDKYDFWGYVFLVDKLDKDSRLIITCKKEII